MKLAAPTRPALLSVPILGAGALLAVVLTADPTGRARASGSAVLTAASVCEAQELKARQAENPELQIQIPAEFDRPYPSLSACRSHDLAWDAEAPGPIQPIPFSHQHHAGQYEIPCAYCHSGTERSPAAGVPSVELCMGCHEHFAKEFDQLEGIRILKQHWEERRAIEWQQIHRLPEYVQFRHNRHVAAGVECQTCHGPVQELHKLYLVPDTKWVNGLPAQKLKMGWCMTCHWERGASVDCLTCHH